MRIFYEILLFCTRLELACAKAAPVRNQVYIGNLLRDEADYDAALIRLYLQL